MNNKIDENRIIYTSDQCMVINKLPGEAAEGAAKGMADLPRELAKQFGGAFTAVQRLDVPVSGCALFARTPKALSFLNAAFSADRVQKYYWAIVEMPPPSLTLAPAGELVHWLEMDPRQNKSTAFAEKAPEGSQRGSPRKQAILRYRVIGKGTNYLFMEIELVTGRHHQIRAQLAALGLHIKGDLKYGSKRSEKAGGIRLHARSLRFPAPGSSAKLPDEFIEVTATPPLRDRLWEDFEAAIMAPETSPPRAVSPVPPQAPSDCS
ncbi:RNA pseudouridine synthase [Treponema primitia]|uniref:RluA family pseudouridine synthase n=1 Tax=Treponema primitia TaxID=88058 RepID=UPI00397F1602